MHHDHFRHYRPNRHRHCAGDPSQDDMTTKPYRTRRHPEETSIQAVLKEAGLALRACGVLMVFVYLLDDILRY